MIDADTQGEIWATYKCDNNHVTVTLIS